MEDFFFKGIFSVSVKVRASCRAVQYLCRPEGGSREQEVPAPQKAATQWL